MFVSDIDLLLQSCHASVWQKHLCCSGFSSYESANVPAKASRGRPVQRLWRANAASRNENARCSVLPLHGTYLFCFSSPYAGVFASGSQVLDLSIFRRCDIPIGSGVTRSLVSGESNQTLLITMAAPDTNYEFKKIAVIDPVSFRLAQQFRIS
jgi:hypothetical protein